MHPSLATRLRQLLADPDGDTVSDDPAVLAAHGGDKWFASHPPEVVVFARSAQDVSATLRFCSRGGIPVTARGAGYGYVGGCVPVRGGVALSLARMNRILELNERDFVAVTQPGVITGDLQAAARAKGLYYPPDPASLKNSSARRQHRHQRGRTEAASSTASRATTCSGWKSCWRTARSCVAGGARTKTRPVSTSSACSWAARGCWASSRRPPCACCRCRRRARRSRAGSRTSARRPGRCRRCSRRAGCRRRWRSPTASRWKPRAASSGRSTSRRATRTCSSNSTAARRPCATRSKSCAR